MNNCENNSLKQDTPLRRNPPRKPQKSKQKQLQSTKKAKHIKKLTKMEMKFHEMADYIDEGRDYDLTIKEHCILTSPINLPHSKTEPKLIHLFCCDEPFSFKNQQHYVYSKESILVPGERGLFAGKSFQKGDIIGVYCGVKVDDSVDVTEYRLLDIEPRKGEHEMLCHYVNDISLSLTFQLRNYAKRIGSNHKKVQCKHKFKNNAKFFGILLEATRNIKRNEEIFADYNYDTDERIEKQEEILRKSSDQIQALVRDKCRDSKYELQEIYEILGVEIEDYQNKRKKALCELILEKL